MNTDKDKSPEMLYNKVLNFCHSYGPDPEYQFLLDVLKEVAAASNGIDENEQKVIDKFSNELTERFKADIDKLNQFRKNEE